MKKAIIIFFGLISIILHGLESSIIIQPCGWDYGEERNIADQVSETIEYFDTHVTVMETGFSVDKRTFSYRIVGNDVLFSNEILTIVLAKEDVSLDENETGYFVSVSTNYLIFIQPRGFS